MSEWFPTSGQAQGSGKVLSLFLHTLRKLRDFRQCMTAVGRLVRRLSDTSSSSTLRRPIQFVAGIKEHQSNLKQTSANKCGTDLGSFEHLSICYKDLTDSTVAFRRLQVVKQSDNTVF